MSSPRRQCEMRIPEELLERMEAVPGGIRPILNKVEKEFGLSTTYSYVGKKIYSIVGPNPDILELAIETLLRRFFGQDDKGSAVSGEIESKRAVWKLQGDYAIKASHLFRTELEQLQKLSSVYVSISPMRLEITSGYNHVEDVKCLVESLQTQIDSLHEQDLDLVGSYAELVKLRQFLQKKNKYDFTVVVILQEVRQKVTIYGRTESAVKKVYDEWTIGNRSRSTSPMRLPVSPSLSYNSVGAHPRFKSEMKIPRGIVFKLEKQRCGMNYILSNIEREFGLKVVYVRKKHMTIYGPHFEMLELAVQTLVHRYVLKSTPEHGVHGLLQGKNAVWRFLGNYAKKVVHLFSKELNRLRKVRTVSIKSMPCKVSPVTLEILCSVRVIEIVKAEVEKIVGLVHNLFEEELEIQDDQDQVMHIKELMQKQNVSMDVLCLFDDKSKRVYVYSRNEMIVWQVISELQAERRLTIRVDSATTEYKKMYRQLYKTKVPDVIVKKLEELPGGVMPLVLKIQNEYGVQTLYQKNKHMVLVSQSAEVLELAQETLEERYACEMADDNGDSSKNVTRNSVVNEGNGKLEELKEEDVTQCNKVNDEETDAINNPDETPGEQTLENETDANPDNTEQLHGTSLPKLKEKKRVVKRKHAKPVHRIEHVSSISDETARIPVIEIQNRHSLTLNRSHERYSTLLSPTRPTRSIPGGSSNCSSITSTSNEAKLRSNLKSSNLRTHDTNYQPKSVSFSG